MSNMELEYTEFTKEHQTELLNDIIDMLGDDYIDISRCGHGDRYEGDMFKMLVNIVKDFKARHDNPAIMDVKRTNKLRSIFVKKNLEVCPLADETVLRFIARFVYRRVETDRDCIRQVIKIQDTFTNGYCWHFAHLLQDTFDGQGDIVHVSGPGNYNHFVWIYKDIPYDISGFVDIPDGYSRTHEKFMGERLNKYKHNHQTAGDVI